MSGRRRSSSFDREHRLAVLGGSIAGVVLGLVTANLGWIAGRLVDLHRAIEAFAR